MTTATTSCSLDVPGVRLHYEVRGRGPLVLLVGSPMDANAFAPLAELLAVDHTVVTTDPRGINRSTLDDPEQDSTPDLRADDFSRLLAHLDAGPATVFGSSGGAVSGLALVQAHPEQVHTLVAHEPPLQELLDDRERRRADTEDIVTAYLSKGSLAAWRRFMQAAGFDLPEPVLQQMFGGEREPQQAADERRFFLHEIRPTTRWVPDVEALSAASTRIVLGIGEQSVGQLCDLTSTALATALGIEPTRFPGGHGGFAEDPAAFARRLLEVWGDS